MYGKINETLYQFLSNIYYKYDLYEKLENFNYSKDIFVTLFKQSNINIPDNIIIKMRKLIRIYESNILDFSEFNEDIKELRKQIQKLDIKKN